MQQNIYLILLFSIVSVLLFYCFPKKYRKYILFSENLLFYGICDLNFLLLIILETFITWFIGNKLNSENKSKSKFFFILGISIVLALLCFFKYFNFFIENFNFSLNKILLPLGISYYSFKCISYLADIYLHKRNNECSFINYSIYIIFFPHLLCGPIVRSNTMTDILDKGVSYDSKKVKNGLLLIISGLFKKIVIADRCSNYVNTVFANFSNYPSLALILALFLYAMQLYCDFAGYSEIATGITNLFGFDCVNNFDRPYFSLSIRDFWKRWHISLSSWLKDYVYIPLGGNRCSTIRKWINVFITFILCGIWHGNNFHFIVWGAYHGLLNNLSTKKNQFGKCESFIRCLITFLLVCIGWLFFRISNLKDAFQYLYIMITKFSLSYGAISNSILPFTGDNTSVPYFVVLVFLIILLFIKEFLEERKSKKNKLPGKESRSELIWSVVFIFFIIFFGVVGKSNFLYANF